MMPGWRWPPSPKLVIAGLLPKIEDALAEKAPAAFLGAGFAVIAMGKLGGRGDDGQFRPRPGVRSSMMLPGGVEASDGAKPLSPTLYFARLGAAA